MTKLKLSRETLHNLSTEETGQVAGAGPTYGLTCGCTLFQCPQPSKRNLLCENVTVGCPLATARC